MVNVERFRSRQFIKPRDKLRGDRKQVIRDAVKESVETPVYARRAGTNYIFNELLGVDNQVVNQYASWYGDRRLKETSRVAAEIKYATGQNPDLRYLFEAVEKFGGRAVLDLTRMKMDLVRLLNDFNVHDFGGVKLLTPMDANVSLEKIAIAKDLTGTLRHSGLSPVYRGERVLVFDYARK